MPLFALTGGSQRKITTPFDKQVHVEVEQGLYNSSAISGNSDVSTSTTSTAVSMRKKHSGSSLSQTAGSLDRRLSSSLDDLQRRISVNSTSHAREKFTAKAKTVSKKGNKPDSSSGRYQAVKSTLSLKSSKAAIKDFFGTMRKKKEAPHICKPVFEGMSRCQCGKSW